MFLFFFCSDNGVHTSRIDHFLCSRSIDVMILQIEILHQFISSDHKPVLILFNNLYGHLVDCNNGPTCGSSYAHDWSVVLSGNPHCY